MLTSRSRIRSAGRPRAISEHDAIEAGLQSAANPMVENLGNVSDWKAVKEYRAKAREMLMEIEEARADGDHTRVEQIEKEMAVIVGVINESVGGGGRLKKTGDKRKNIRDSFRNNVNRVIEKQIKQTDPQLAAHLKAAIIFGNDPRYVPQDGLTWETRPVQNG